MNSNNSRVNIAMNVEQIATVFFFVFFGSFGSQKHHIKNRTKSDHQKGIFLTCWQKMKKKSFLLFQQQNTKMNRIMKYIFFN